MYNKVRSHVREPQLRGGLWEDRMRVRGPGRQRQAVAASSGKLCFVVQEFWEFSQASGMPRGSSLTFVWLVSFGDEIPA